MKIYKLTMSNREVFTLPEEKLNAILQDKSQIVKVNLDDEWVLINKAHIISARVDRDETNRINRSKNILPESPMTDEERKLTLQKLKAIRQNVFN